MESNSSNSTDQVSSWKTVESAEAWRRGSEERAEFLREATELMFSAAKVGEGAKVLDVAAGTGDLTLIAARLAGPSGNVVSTDISENMLNIVKELAHNQGLSNVKTSVMDAQYLDFPPESFDSVISRYGLMFIPDLQKALTGMHRVLRKDGRVVALVWSKAEKNPAFSIPMSILSRAAGLQPQTNGGTGVFALGDPDSLAVSFQAAGFRDVNVQAVPLVHRAPSAEQFIQSRKEAAAGEMGEALERLSDEERSRTFTEILRALRQYEGPKGFEVPGESLLVVGTK